MSSECMKFFSSLIEKELGIVYGEHNWFQLEARLQEISKVTGVSGVDELHRAAQEGIKGDLKKLILDCATNNETSFFRDARVFDAIEKIILPQIFALVRPDETLRIWSAASSYGQEPYSLAILLSEMAQRVAVPKFEILATDVCGRVLERATRGVFTQMETERGLPPELLAKYFKKTAPAEWSANSSLRACIRFQRQNLKEPLNLGTRFHFVLCRNVLIYQRSESKTEIVNRIRDTLVPGGLLVLGAGESLIGLSEGYDSLQADGVVLYRLNSKLIRAS